MEEEEEGVQGVPSRRLVPTSLEEGRARADCWHWAAAAAAGTTPAAAALGWYCCCRRGTCPGEAEVVGEASAHGCGPDNELEGAGAGARSTRRTRHVGSAGIVVVVAAVAAVVGERQPSWVGMALAAAG